MQATDIAHRTLVSTLGEGPNKLLVRVALVLAGSMLLFISAKFEVPVGPVPFTMQTFVVLTLGMTLGWRLGALAVLAYLAEGAMGLPVFAQTPEKGLGLAYMAGPTGGYLLGFVLAAAATGWLAERGWDRFFLTTALAMLIGNALIYAPGLAWLAYLIGAEQAVQFGLAPFIVGDVLKLLLGAATVPLCWRLLRR
jgi:biotin transport system substrate-specific component